MMCPVCKSKTRMVESAPLHPTFTKTTVNYKKNLRGKDTSVRHIKVDNLIIMSTLHEVDHFHRGHLNQAYIAILSKDDALLARLSLNQGGVRLRNLYLGNFFAIRHPIANKL